MQAISIILMITMAYANPACEKSLTTASGTHAKIKTPICSGDLVFEDNFNSLDFSIWQHENTLAGGGNWEFQWYTNNRSNSYTENGILKIKPTLTADHLGETALYKSTLDLNGGSPADQCTNPQWYGCVRTGTLDHVLNPVKSARIRSVHSFSFCYGRVEIRAKAPLGDWIWGAIWMLPKYNSYGGWPTSGEIDILENRGNSKLVEGNINIGVQQVGSTLHWGLDYAHDAYQKTHAVKNNANGFNSDFHTYEVIWTNTSITFKIDNEELFSTKPPSGGFWELGNFGSTGYLNPWTSGNIMAPFDQEFYFVINLAVGGISGYFPDSASNPSGKPWSNKSPKAATDFWHGKNAWLPTWDLKGDGSALQVDYIRVYAL